MNTQTSLTPLNCCYKNQKPV